jgi:hypothetical protein
MFLKSRSLKNAHAGADASILRAFFPKVNHPQRIKQPRAYTRSLYRTAETKHEIDNIC